MQCRVKRHCKYSVLNCKHSLFHSTGFLPKHEVRILAPIFVYWMYLYFYYDERISINVHTSAVPFLGAMRVEGLKNFFTVVTLRIFSLVFFSSNLEKGAREAWPCGGVDWARGCGWDWDWDWDWDGGPWLLA